MKERYLALWGEAKDVRRIVIKIRQLKLSGAPELIKKLSKKSNLDLKEFLQ